MICYVNTHMHVFVPTCKCHSPAGWSLGRWRSTAPAPESWTPLPRPRTGCCSLRSPPGEKSQSNNYLTAFSMLSHLSVTWETSAHWPSWGWALGWIRGPAPRWSRSPAWRTRWAWWWGRKESSCNTCHSEGSPHLRCSSPAWTEKHREGDYWLISVLTGILLLRNHTGLQYSLWRAGGAGGLRGREGLQDVWLPLLAELLEHVFVVPCHLTGVALNPAGQK